MSYQIVVVGSSWGGMYAIRTILAGLPTDFALPIVVAQHQAQDPGAGFAQSLESHTGFAVEEVADKTTPRPGHVYIAPPDYHTLVDDGLLTLSTDRHVHHSRPSIDVLFESAADAFGGGVIAVILTGANRDGASGLSRIKEAGGYTIVQDPETASQPAMPRAALETTRPNQIAPLEEIASILAKIAQRSSRGVPA